MRRQENRVDDKERQLTMKWEKLTDTVVELAEQQQQPEVVTQPALRPRSLPLGDGVKVRGVADLPKRNNIKGSTCVPKDSLKG